MRVADAFLTLHGQVYRLWPYEASHEVHHFLFEADARRLGALVEAVRAFERTAQIETLVDFLARERPGFDLALDAVRGHVLVSELEAALREDGDARSTWLDARKDTGSVRTHRYRKLWLGLRRLRQLEELGAAPEMIQFERDGLHQLVREPPSPGALVQTARERAEAGYPHEVFGLCLQTTLLPEAEDLGMGQLLSLTLDPGPCLLARTLISSEMPGVDHVSALLSDGQSEDLGAITWGARKELEQAAHDLGSAGEYASKELAPALARLGARGACAVSFTAVRRDEEE
jgi:hypothetical protein